MVCPAGTYLIGRYPCEQDSSPNEDPQHEVTLTHGFWLGKYMLTKAQRQAVMGTKPWVGHSDVFQALNTAINITRTTFEEIRADAIFVRPPETKSGDGRLGGQDASLILQYYAGRITCFHADYACSSGS